MLRCRYFEQPKSLSSSGLAWLGFRFRGRNRSWAAFGNGRNTGANARYRNPCLAGATLARTAWFAMDANLIQKGLNIREVAGPSIAQNVGDADGVTNHVDLGGQATSVAPQRMVYRLC